MNLDISILVGKTLAFVHNHNDDQIVFETIDGETYKLYHLQNCCESVRVEELIGDLADLVGSPILQAEKVSGSGGDGRFADTLLAVNALEPDDWINTWDAAPDLLGET